MRQIIELVAISRSRFPSVMKSRAIRFLVIDKTTSLVAAHTDDGTQVEAKVRPAR